MTEQTAMTAGSEEWKRALRAIVATAGIPRDQVTAADLDRAAAVIARDWPSDRQGPLVPAPDPGEQDAQVIEWLRESLQMSAEWAGIARALVSTHRRLAAIQAKASDGGVTVESP